jgi:[ribosomal protein S5]-alanine N-acetyltransferase
MEMMDVREVRYVEAGFGRKCGVFKHEGHGGFFTEGTKVFEVITALPAGASGTSAVLTFTAMLQFPFPFPELRTQRLLLRPVRDADAPAILRLYSDMRVMEFRGEPLFTDISQAQQLIFHWRKIFAAESGLRWGIELRQTGTLLGTLGFKHVWKQHGRADLGYELDPAWWNRGIMTEAVDAVTNFGLGPMKLHSIEANITPGHQASQRVLEKLGFRKEAHFRENYFYEGWWDSGIWVKRGVQ